jgi:hypothetical protein
MGFNASHSRTSGEQVAGSTLRCNEVRLHAGKTRRMQSLWRRRRSLINRCMALRLIFRLPVEQWRHQAVGRREGEALLLMSQTIAIVD